MQLRRPMRVQGDQLNTTVLVRRAQMRFIGTPVSDRRRFCRPFVTRQFDHLGRDKATGLVAVEDDRGIRRAIHDQVHLCRWRGDAKLQLSGDFAIGGFFNHLDELRPHHGVDTMGGRRPA